MAWDYNVSQSVLRAATGILPGMCFVRYSLFRRVATSSWSNRSLHNPDKLTKMPGPDPTETSSGMPTPAGISVEQPW